MPNKKTKIKLRLHRTKPAGKGKKKTKPAEPAGKGKGKGKGATGLLLAGVDLSYGALCNQVADEAARQLLLQTISACASMEEAADKLGMSRTHLFRELKRLGVTSHKLSRSPK